MEYLKVVMNQLENPAIRFTVIGVFSTFSAGIYVMVNKSCNRFKYDTVTDLKKKAKAFTKLNYQQDKNKSNKKAF